MSKKPSSVTLPWEVVRDGEGDFRIRVKGSVRRRLGFQLERPVAEGFHCRKDAVLAASAPDLALALRALLDDYVALHDSGDAGCVLSEDDPVRLAAESLLKRVKV